MSKWNNYDYVLQRVKNERCEETNLQYASKELQNNFVIVKEAVKNCRLSLQFASDNLKNDYEIV
jgi:hypothetical protein